MKNELEAFSYEMRNSLDQYGHFEKYVQEQDRVKLLEMANQTVDWLYGEGHHSSLESYKEKLGVFKQLGQPIKERYRFHSEWPIYVG